MTSTHYIILASALALWSIGGALVLFVVCSFNTAMEGKPADLSWWKIAAYGPGVWALAWYLKP